MNRKLTNTELSMVCEVIASRTGLNFSRERWPVLSRNLASAAKELGFQSMNEFIPWLLSSELNKDQIMILASHLAISETYFWREPQVFSALTDYVLPEYIKSKKRGEKSIRIWSAGCSTGEEPYSIAIALHETVPKIKDWDITILATDIDQKSLGKAVSGIYSTWSFRNSPAWLKSRYFHKKEERRYEIIPEIKQMVTFTCLSLLEMSDISNNNTMDIIFCRNVLMYFTSEWVSEISRNLFNSLSEDGWFIVSSSELSSYVFPQFTPVNFPGAVLYRKGKNGSAHSLYSESVPEKKTQPVILDVEKLKSVEVESNKIDPSTLRPYNSITLQQTQSKPEESYTDKVFAIRLLANQGFLSEAHALCDEAIVSDKLNSVFYFIQASILQEMDKNSEAIDSLKKAIYIDPNYIMGHFTLGNLFIRQGNTKNAERYFNNALDLLSRCANDDIMPAESEGLSVKYIREIIIANMQTQLAK